MLTERDKWFVARGEECARTGISLLTGPKNEDIAPPLYRWTSDPPTKPGWYWWRPTVRERAVPVYYIRDKTGDVSPEQFLHEFWDDSPMWAGPIQEPGE